MKAIVAAFLFALVIFMFVGSEGDDGPVFEWLFISLLGALVLLLFSILYDLVRTN